MNHQETTLLATLRQCYSFYQENSQQNCENPLYFENYCKRLLENQDNETFTKLKMNLISHCVLLQISSFLKDNWSESITQIKTIIPESYSLLIQSYLFKNCNKFPDVSDFQKIISENQNNKFERLILLNQMIKISDKYQPEFQKTLITELAKYAQRSCSLPPESTQIISLKVLESILVPKTDIIQIALDSVQLCFRKNQTPFVKSQACILFSKILIILLYFQDSFEASLQFPVIFDKYKEPSRVCEILTNVIHFFDFQKYAPILSSNEYFCSLLIKHIPEIFEYIFEHITLEECLHLFEFVLELTSKSDFPILNHLQPLLALCTDRTQLSDLGDLILKYVSNKNVPDFHFLRVISKKLVEIDQEWCFDFYDNLLQSSPTPSLAFLVRLLSKKLDISVSSAFSEPSDPSYWYLLFTLNESNEIQQIDNNLQRALSCSNIESMIQALGSFFKKNMKKLLQKNDQLDFISFEKFGEILLKNLQENSLSLYSLICYPAIASKLFKQTKTLDSLATFFIQKTLENSPGHRFYQQFLTNSLISPEELIDQTLSSRLDYELNKHFAENRENEKGLDDEKDENEKDLDDEKDETIERKFSQEVLMHFSEIFDSVTDSTKQSIILSLTTAEHNLKMVNSLLLCIVRSQTGKYLFPPTFPETLFKSLSLSINRPDFLKIQITSELISNLLSSNNDQNIMNVFLQNSVFPQMKPYSCILLGSLSNFVQFPLDLLNSIFSFLKKSLSSPFCVPFALHSLNVLISTQYKQKISENSDDEKSDFFKKESIEIFEILLTLISSDVAQHPIVLMSIAKVFIALLPYLNSDCLPEVSAFLSCIFFIPLSFSKTILKLCLKSLKNTSFSSLISEFDFNSNDQETSQNKRVFESKVQKIKSDPFSLKSIELSRTLFKKFPEERLSFLCVSLTAADLRVVRCVYHELIVLLEENKQLFVQYADQLEQLAIYAQEIEENEFLEFYFLHTTKLNPLFFTKISEKIEVFPNISVLSAICYCAKRLKINSLSFAAFSSPFLSDTLLAIVESDFIPDVIPSTLVPAFLWTEKQKDDLVYLHRDLFSECLRIIKSHMDNDSNSEISENSHISEMSEEEKKQNSAIQKFAICGLSELIGYMYNEDELIDSSAEIVLTYLKKHSTSQFALEFFQNLSSIKKGIKFVFDSIIDCSFTLTTVMNFISNYNFDESFGGIDDLKVFQVNIHNLSAVNLQVNQNINMSVSEIISSLANRFLTLNQNSPEKLETKDLIALFGFLITKAPKKADLIANIIISKLNGDEINDQNLLLTLLENAMQSPFINVERIFNALLTFAKSQEQNQKQNNDQDICIEFGSKLLISTNYLVKENGKIFAQVGCVDRAIEQLESSNLTSLSQGIQYIMLVIEKDSKIVTKIAEKLIPKILGNDKPEKDILQLFVTIARKNPSEIESLWSNYDESQKNFLTQLLEKSE